MDIDVIMSWPLHKIHEYMAFYLSETEEFKEKLKDEALTPEERTNQLLQLLGGKK